MITAEQRELAESERAWLGKHDPIDHLRSQSGRAGSPEGLASVDPRALTHVRESGLASILTADAGGTHPDLAVLTAEHGRAASSLPVADLALGAWLLEFAGRADLADAHASGDRVVTVVTSPYGQSLHGDRIAAISAPFVVLPDPADRDLVVLTDDDALFVLPAGASRRKIETFATLDLTRPWARARLDVDAAERVALPVGTASWYRDAIAVHRAVDSVGAAEELLTRTVEYAGQREQFGAVIGSFQAVKHHCATMAVRVSAAQATLGAAVDSLALSEASDRRRPVDAAVAYAADAANSVAGLAQQVHGGIGFTWEHDLHLYLRRIKVNGNIDGGVRERRRALVS